MANFSLAASGNTNIQTTFRYMVQFPASGTINDTVTGYCTSTNLPVANGEVIPWNLPMGPVNHQAGKRKTEPLPMEFLVTTDGIDDAIGMFDGWFTKSYNLNTGTNAGKANYCVDGVKIYIIDESGNANYTFTLNKAQPTTLAYTTMSSESNELLKVTMTLVYDNFSISNVTTSVLNLISGE